MDAETARQLVRERRFCVLSSSSRDGHPWVTPLFFNYDAAYRIVFESGREARHSQLIAENPHVAIVVARLRAETPLKGVYLECEAREVPPDRLAEALEVFKHGPHAKKAAQGRRVEDYLGDKPLRLYEAVYERAYSLVTVQTPEGYEIDHRVEISLR